MDIYQILLLPGWSVERLYTAMLRFRDIAPEGLAADLRAAHEQDPDDFVAYGMSLEQMDGMFERLDAASREALLLKKASAEHPEPARLDRSQGRKASGRPDGGEYTEKTQSPREISLGDSGR